MKYCPLIVAVCLFFSCADSTDLWIRYADVPEPEKLFLASLLDSITPESLRFRLRNEPDREPPPSEETVTLRFERRRGTWQEDETPPDTLPLTRVCMVRPVEVWEERNISLETVSEADLIPLSDLAPPFVACKVDGFDVSDPRYPLVYESGIRLEYGETKKALRKAEALRERIREKLEEAGISRRGDHGRGEEAAPPPQESGESGTPPAAVRYEQKPGLYRIAAGGDVMLARGVEDILFAEGPAGILGGTAVFVKEADLSLINLEGTVSSRGDEIKKTYVFRFDPRTAAALKNAGFDAALMANNHAFDYGITGFLDSLDHLEQAGLAVLGAGRNIRAAAVPFVSAAPPSSGGFPVRVFGLASFGQERNGWDGLTVAAEEQKPGILHAGKGGAEAIKPQLDKNALNIIVYHGGVEYADYPDRGTRALYTELIESGADLVIGTHPHVEQGFEWVQGKPVFWSLGDYVFNEMDDTPGGDKGIFIILYYYRRRLVHIDIYPLFMNGKRTEIMPMTQLERFYRLTRDLARR